MHIETPHAAPIPGQAVLQPPEITAANWIMVATLGLVWGASFLLISIALEGITPFWLAAGRIAFAALLTVSVWRLRGGRLWLSEARSPFVLMGMGLTYSALPFVLLSWGQQHVTSGFAGVSMAAVALMVLPLAHVFVPGERMHPRRVLGFVIGFCGVVVLIGGQALASTGEPLETAGRLACLGAACCYAISSISMRNLPPADPVGLAAVPLLFGCCYVIPVAWIVEGPPPLPDARTLWVLALLGLIPTAGANLLRVLVIRSAGPVFMSLVNYQVPLWSVLLGILVLDETAPASLITALSLILAGVALSQWGALRRLFGSR